MQKKRVLIAEDYADVRQMMKIMVEFYGYEAIEASDGHEAVEKTMRSRPDMILMDISMPVMDGLAATEAIRKSEGNRRIPIIAVTAYGDLYREKAKEAGCNTVVAKPINFEELKPLLDEYLFRSVPESDRGH
jgi:two-component system cell cycle response regulator DivK